MKYSDDNGAVSSTNTVDNMLQTPKQAAIQVEAVHSTTDGYLQVILPQNPASLSQKQNLTGLTRQARDLSADLYNNIQRWNDHHIQGSKIIKSIAWEKVAAHEMYPKNIEPYTTAVHEIVKKLQDIVAELEVIRNEMSYLPQLYKTARPLFLSLTTEQIVHLTNEIVDAYLEELQIKEMVSEEIAHCRSQHDIMFYASCWVHQHKITQHVKLKLEALLTETGHRQIL